MLLLHKPEGKIYYFPSYNASPVFALGSRKLFSKDGEEIAFREIVEYANQIGLQSTIVIQSLCHKMSHVQMGEKLINIPKGRCTNSHTIAVCVRYVGFAVGTLVTAL